MNARNKRMKRYRYQGDKKKRKKRPDLEVRMSELKTQAQMDDAAALLKTKGSGCTHYRQEV